MADSREKGDRRVPRRNQGWVPAVLALALAVGGCSGAATKESTSDRGDATERSVRLSPDPAYAAARIEVVLDSRWIDPAKCRFRWRRDGNIIPEAATGVLEPSCFSKGQRIGVEVLMDDPESGKRHTLSAEVEVVNTPPTISRATLFMTEASEIGSNVTVSDPDGDPVSFRYQWYKNDRLIAGERGPSIKTSRLSRGDRVVAEVVASDGVSSSPPFRSEDLRIENRPPEFSSDPVAPKAGDTLFRYRATAVDPDRDLLRYELVSGPSGMKMGPEGTIVWPLPGPDERQGEHQVRIRVTDSKGGEAVQEFSLHFAATEPTP
jgi:hypothetical protein